MDLGCFLLLMIKVFVNFIQLFYLFQNEVEVHWLNLSKTKDLLVQY